MIAAALLGTLGAGLGLGVGLAMNVRLAAHARHAVLASLVNFVVGTLVTGLLFLLGLGAVAAPAPGAVPLWALLGGVAGATYVTLSLLTAARLGVAASTAAVTLGQVVVARVVDHFGLLGSVRHDLRPQDALGAALLLAAVVLLGRERARASGRPGGAPPADREEAKV